MIYVFGSNLKGIHGAGSAKIAVQQYGAKIGVGEGRTGNSYAIPTKFTPYKVRPLMDVKISIDRFKEYAWAYSQLKEYFHVVRVGCGLAGFTDEQMAPLFIGSPNSCFFAPAWQKYGLRTWEEEPYDSQ